MNHSITSTIPVGVKFASWAQIGDLHITTADQQNYRDLQMIVRELNYSFGGRHGIDFVYLPGDNADNGNDAQYQLVLSAINSLILPVHAIPGDHDAQSRTLDAFYRAFPDNLPRWFVKPGYRFVFLNSVNTPDGKGFDMDRSQLDFIDAIISQATQAKETLVLFMHTYPSELSCATRIRSLLCSPCVKLVAMGHTHYNEVSNDGRILYTATRSTGQIEEGPVGFSVTCMYNDLISWKFKELGDDNPFVMIVTPADAAFVTGEKSLTEMLTKVRAKVWDSALLKSASLQIDHGEMRPMYLDDIGGFLQCDCDLSRLAEGTHILTVTIITSDVRHGEDEISIHIGNAQNAKRQVIDMDNVIAANPRKGLLGTQLGPNKNGHPW